MYFRSPLIEATLIRRYKRFLADVEMLDGRLLTVHCANPGSMLGLQDKGATVWLANAVNPKAKLPYSWELIEADLPGGKQCVGINTLNPNRLAQEALESGVIAELMGYAQIKREVVYGTRSRVDFLLLGDSIPDCFIEVKNCHLMRQVGLAEFPDCVTARGAKHLDELTKVVAQGHRAVMLFIVQMQAEAFTIASDLDPAYARAFAAARSSGVEAYAYTCKITRKGITVHQRIPIVGGA
jgi:sugar fermentation stimulation protein A